MKDTQETDRLHSGSAVEEEIIAMSALNFERMPMLDLIFERFVLSLAKAFRSYTSAPTTAEIVDIHYTTYDHAMLAVGEPCMTCIAETRPWAGPVAVAMGSDFLYASLEVIMGGRSTGAADTARRSFTRIETRIARKLCDVALADLAESFHQVADISFEIKRMEGTAQLATITQPHAACVKADFNVLFGGTGGVMSIILPHASVEPIRTQLTKVFYGDRLGGDNEWRGHLTKGIQNSSMPVTAVLGNVTLPLRDVLGWKPGQTIDLGVTDDEDATVHCAGMPVASGPVGQRENGMLAVRVTDTIGNLSEIGAQLPTETNPTVTRKGDH